MQRQSRLKNLNIVVKLTTIIVAKPDLFTPKPIPLGTVLLCHFTNLKLTVSSKVYRSILGYTNSLVSKVKETLTFSAALRLIFSP